MTLIPLKLYFNEKGRAEIELALARGDKHETLKNVRGSVTTAA